MLISLAASLRRAIVRALLAAPLLSFVLLLSGCAEEQGYYPQGDRERVYRSVRSDNQDYYRDERRDDYQRDDYRRDNDGGGHRRYEREERRDGDENDGEE